MNSNIDSELRLKAIFDAAVDGIIIIDRRGIIEEANASACGLFGYDISEITGKNVNILMPAEHSKQHDSYLQAYQQSGHAKIIGLGREVEGKKKNGDIFPFWLAVIEINLENRIIYTGFIHDLTGIKNAEKNLKTMNENLEKKVVERTYELENAVNQLLSLNRKLEDEISNRIKAQNKLRERETELEKSLVKERELGELKSRFVSMASHEFRTPLSTILSSVSLIGRYTESDQQANRDKHIHKVKSSVTHLTGILNDFLSMNILEEGKISSVIENFDLEVLSHEVVEELRTILKSNQQIVIEKKLIEEQVWSDKKILKNILINLLSNAIKYSDNNGIIKFIMYADDQSIVISIIDNGIGIPDEDQRHLFDRFFRASNVINIEGTGLGLNIVRKYIEILKGEISFTSKLYEGTTFTIKIPNQHFKKIKI